MLCYKSAGADGNDWRSSHEIQTREPVAIIDKHNPMSKIPYFRIPMDSTVL